MSKHNQSTTTFFRQSKAKRQKLLFSLGYRYREDIILILKNLTFENLDLGVVESRIKTLREAAIKEGLTAEDLDLGGTNNRNLNPKKEFILAKWANTYLSLGDLQDITYNTIKEKALEYYSNPYYLLLLSLWSSRIYRTRIPNYSEKNIKNGLKKAKEILIFYAEALDSAPTVEVNSSWDGGENYSWTMDQVKRKIVQLKEIPEEEKPLFTQLEQTLNKFNKSQKTINNILIQIRKELYGEEKLTTVDSSFVYFFWDDSSYKYKGYLKDFGPAKGTIRYGDYQPTVKRFNFIPKLNKPYYVDTEAGRIRYVPVYFSRLFKVEAVLATNLTPLLHGDWVIDNATKTVCLWPQWLSYLPLPRGFVKSHFNEYTLLHWLKNYKNLSTRITKNVYFEFLKYRRKYQKPKPIVFFDKLSKYEYPKTEEDWQLVSEFEDDFISEVEDYPEDIENLLNNIDDL